MKRIAVLVLALCLAFALAACAKETPAGGPDGKVLVAYFSITNNTQRVAEDIADILGADIYEIVPEVAYTSADLDDNNTSCRSYLEQNDASARPAISGSVENMAQYGTIFLGYPIWWGDAPKILHTFLESYDFSGKTIIPFCTSSSSGIGSSATNLHPLTSGAANWLDGMRFPSSAARQTVAEWIDELSVEADA